MHWHLPCIVGKGGNGRAGTGLGMAGLESKGQVGMKQAQCLESGGCGGSGGRGAPNLLSSSTFTLWGKGLQGPGPALASSLLRAKATWHPLEFLKPVHTHGRPAPHCRLYPCAGL